MTRRASLALIAAALLGAACNEKSACESAPSAAPGASSELGLAYHAQHTEVWCWAAVSASVADYFRNVVGQDCQFLSVYAAREYGQAVDCCWYPAACYRPALSMQEIQHALGVVAGIYSSRAGGPLDEATLKRELANGRPVIVGLRNSFNGHVVVISGYDQSGYHVQDPYWGEFYGVPYATILFNPEIGAWADTLYLLGTEDYCQ